MTPPLLTLEPLTKAAFAPFGTVIETEGAPRLPINQGTTTRFDALAAIDAAHGGIPCKINFSICIVTEEDSFSIIIF